MAYYIKTLGIKNRPVSVYKERFSRLILSHVCFKTKEGKVAELKAGDSFVVYCLKNGIKEYPKGGFVAIQDVLGPVYEDATLFGPAHQHVVDVQPKLISLRNGISLREVSQWKHMSKRLQSALKANLQAIGGLLAIDRSDYALFVKVFSRKISEAIKVKKERQVEFKVEAEP